MVRPRGRLSRPGRRAGRRGFVAGHCQVVGLIGDARHACAVRACPPHRAPRCHTPIAIKLGTPVISDDPSKNRATIEANYIIDKAHKHPNPAEKDADMHVAGRAPTEIGLATVAEIMNAADRSDATDAVHSAEGTGQSVKVAGVWRIWAEHGGDTEHEQGKKLAAFNTTNPPHLFEIHPVTGISGIDVRDTLHPIEGYEPKDAERAFGVYERTRSRITPMSGKKIKIETPMAGMNYVKFEMELSEKALPIADGIRTGARRRRAPPPAQAAHGLRKRDLAGGGGTQQGRRRLPGRARHSADQPGSCGVARRGGEEGRTEVLTWGLPYEIVVVGVYNEQCHESDD